MKTTKNAKTLHPIQDPGPYLHRHGRLPFFLGIGNRILRRGIDRGRNAGAKFFRGNVYRPLPASGRIRTAWFFLSASLGKESGPTAAMALRLLTNFKTVLAPWRWKARPAGSTGMKDFNGVRRQKFMHEKMYETVKDGLAQGDEPVPPYPESPDKHDLEYVAALSGRCGAALDRLSLEYTAGAPMEEVKALYPAAVQAFEAWCEADANASIADHPGNQRLRIPNPVEFDVPASYLQVLRLLSLGILFNEGKLLRKISGLLHAGRIHDAVIEELLGRVTPDPIEDSGLLHPVPYGHLISAIGEDYARALRVLHDGVKFGSAESAVYLFGTFDDGDPMVDHIKDSARARRYSVLADALERGPDLRLPSLDKVLPPPPAQLPKWNGDRQTLINAAKPMVSAPLTHQSVQVGDPYVTTQEAVRH